MVKNLRKILFLVLLPSLILISGCIFDSEGKLYYLALDRVTNPENLSELVIPFTKSELENYPPLLSAFETLYNNEKESQVFLRITSKERDEVIKLFEDLGYPLDLVDYLPRYASYDNITAGVWIMVAME